MSVLLIIGYVLVLASVIYTTWSAHSTTKDFMIAKKTLGPWEIATSSTAGVLDVTSIFVLFGAVLFFGSAGIGMWVAYLLATVIIAVLTPYFYDFVSAEDVWTFSDFFKVRFGKVTEKIFAAVSTIFVFGLIVGLYSINLILFEYFFSIGPVWSTLISFVITITYVVAGGFKALVRTDMVQYVIMLVFLSLAVFFFPETEGVIESINFDEVFKGAFLMVAPVFFFQNLVKPAAWQPVIGAKSKTAAQTGMWLAVFLNILIVVPLVWISASYAYLFPDSAPMEVLLDALGTALPAFLTPFIFIGLLAALMSSLDSALFFVSSNLTHNLLPISLVKRVGELKLVRYVVILVSLVTVGLAVLVPDFITFVLSITPLMGVIAIPFVLSLFVTRAGIDWSTATVFLAGAITFVYLFVNPPAEFVWNILPALVAGAVFIVSATLTRSR